MTDFAGGLADANEYLNRTVSVPTNVTVDPTTGVVTTTESSFTMRELICALLAGNGLKLPNLQICIKANLGRLLNDAGVNWQGALADLETALKEAEEALEKFTAHTDIENVLNRLNSAVAEFAAIANMINFCATPITPRAIPNVLGDMFGSFTGEGKRLLDNLGKMADTEIGGCIDASGNFKPIFNGGVLFDIQQNLSNLANLPQSTLDGFKDTLNAFKNDINNLIDFENGFGNGSTETGILGKGGSTFATTDRVHTGVGVGIDPNNITISQAQGMAGALKSNYDSLKNYEVDGNGNNIFFYLLEPELIAKLEDENNPISDISTQNPVYDYCGKIIGYTNTAIQGNTATSTGTTASYPNQPGLSALSTAGQVVHNAPNTTTNLAGNANTTASTGGSSGNIASLAVSTANASLSPALQYNGSTGTLTYTPPDLSKFTQTTSLAAVALSNDYYSLDNLPSVTVPTVVSAFTNDSGYITSTQAKGLLSVTTNSASGNGSLSYNSGTGEFTFTPADVSSGGGSSNQTLNTTSNVTFADITSTGTFNVNSMNVSGTGNVALSSGNNLTLSATDRVEVTGQTPFKLSNMTTAQRNGLTASNGDTIFNSDTNKFQGYANGAWVDLN